MKDVPAPTCLRDKVSVRSLALQGQFAEVGFDWRHQMRALWWNRDTASRAQQLPLPTVGTHGDITSKKAAVSKVNSRTIAKQRKIYFLREGFVHLCKKRCQTPRRDILAEANDWTVAADLEGMWHYPQVLIESGKWPGLVLVSPSMDAIILASHGDITRSFEKCGRKSSSLQSKLAHDRKSAKDLFLARGLCTPLQKEMSNSQARHSCRGKRLDCRSRPRRDEALSPGADRKWQEAGFGARVVVNGCHHSGGADGTVGGQASIQQCAQSR